MKFSLQSVVLSALFVLFTFGQLSAQTLEEIVAKNVDAMGGPANLDKLKSIKMSTVIQMMGIEVPSEIVIAAGLGVRSDIEVQGMTISQAFDMKSGIGWAIGPDGQQMELPAQASEAMKGQVDLTGLYKYKEKGIQLELLGEDKFEDKPVVKIKTTNPGGLSSTLFISKETYLVVRMESKNMGVETTVVQRDYKNFSGYMSPQVIETTSSQMPGQSMKALVKSITVNSPVDPAIFAKPSK